MLDKQEAVALPVKPTQQHTLVVGNYKFNYLSKSKRQQLQTWRCSERSCKGRIYVTNAGNLVGASEDHNHGELHDREIQDGPSNQVLIHKEVKKPVVETIEIKEEEPTRQREVKKRGKRTIGNRKDQPDDEELALPKLGPAFSVADCPDVMSAIIQQTNQAHSFDPEKIKKEQDEDIFYGSHQEVPLISSSPTISEHSSSHKRDGNDEVFIDFTVTKNTGIMRNILEEALQRLTNPEDSTETHNETTIKPTEPVAGPSHSENPLRQAKEEPEDLTNTYHHTIHSATVDHSYAAKHSGEKVENGGLWRCGKMEPVEKLEEEEEEEEEIYVDDIDKDADDDGSCIDEEEMAAMLGGPWM